MEAFPLLVLEVEGPDDPGTLVVLPRLGQQFVDIALHRPEARHRDTHDEVDDDGQHRNRDREDEGRAGIHDEGHDGGAEDDEGRAQQQAQRHVHAGLDLVHVPRHAVDQRRQADLLAISQTEGLDVLEEGLLGVAGEEAGRLGREVLRRDGDGQPRQRKGEEDEDHAHDVWSVPRRYACVDDRGDDERHEELKDGFQELEERREDALAPIGGQMAEELSHPFPPQATMNGTATTVVTISSGRGSRGGAQSSML